MPESLPAHVYATCPQSKTYSMGDYDRRIADVAAWSERAGAYGILIYTDNSIVDPWLVAQRVIESTRRLRPH